MTIVGVDLMLVERVIGRLTWGRVLVVRRGVRGLVRPVRRAAAEPVQPAARRPSAPILVGLASGILFGLVFAAVGYGATRGRRDFTSASQMVAGRYDVLCQPRNAEKARELLAKLAMGPPNPA